jgi:hypothetical protein
MSEVEITNETLYEGIRLGFIELDKEGRWVLTDAGNQSLRDYFVDGLEAA